MTLRHGFVLAALLCGAPVIAGETPAAVVGRFYAWALHPEPGQGDAGPTLPPSFFAPELLRALQAQRAYEDACARLVAPDIKPHMLDQSPFVLAPDGAKAVLSIEAVASGDGSRASVQLAYDEVRWTDTVVLRREQGRWMIVDIVWQEGGSLTERLVDFAGYQCTP